MSRKKHDDADDRPREVLMPIEDLERVAADQGGSGRRSARNDPAMRDGDSSHGTPYETDTGEVTTDNDVGDTASDGPYSGPAGGSVGGAVSGGRARGGRTGRGLSPGGDHPGDSTVGS